MPRAIFCVGNGNPENASVVGFPPAYFVEQMRAFRDGPAKVLRSGAVDGSP